MSGRSFMVGVPSLLGRQVSEIRSLTAPGPLPGARLMEGLSRLSRSRGRFLGPSGRKQGAGALSTAKRAEGVAALATPMVYPRKPRASDSRRARGDRTELSSQVVPREVEIRFDASRRSVT